MLVIIVVFIFLQGWRAVLIPFVAVPVSLIGTFAFFPLFGFSINTLSLFGSNGAGHRRWSWMMPLWWWRHRNATLEEGLEPKVGRYQSDG